MIVKNLPQGSVFEPWEAALALASLSSQQKFVFPRSAGRSTLRLTFLE